MKIAWICSLIRESEMQLLYSTVRIIADRVAKCVKRGATPMAC